MKPSYSSQSGFTLIELIISITVASLMLVGIFGALSSIWDISYGAAHRTAASNLAYANLRNYANGSAPTWFSCNPSNETATVTLLNKTGDVNKIPGNVEQTVTADAPYGCTGDNNGMPIRVVSTVTTSKGLEVSHATYTGY